MRVSSTLALLFAALAGCRSNPPAATTGGSAMSPAFSKAYLGFRDYAAVAQKVRPDQVRLGPVEELIADMPDQGRIGRLWRFATAGDEVRGWASPEGTVVTRTQNLGLLLEEGGLWRGTANVDALAQCIVWALGQNYRLAPGRPAPVLSLNQGAGTLVLFAAMRPPGPGALEFVYQATITITADHKASLQLSDNLNR